MDNKKQVLEIKQYRKRLSALLEQDVDENTAARLWIQKYAGIWRISHPIKSPCALR